MEPNTVDFALVGFLRDGNKTKLTFVDFRLGFRVEFMEIKAGGSEPNDLNYQIIFVKSPAR